MTTTFPDAEDDTRFFTRADGSVEGHDKDHGRVIHIWENVWFHGAKADGVSDDQPAIQRAINAASAAGGGIVYCPEGTYLLGTGSSNGSRLQMASNVWILGAGRGVTKFKVAAGVTNTSQGVFAGLNVINVGFADFDIDLNKANVADLGTLTNQFGIYIVSTSGPTTGTVVQRVGISNGSETGLQIVSNVTTATKTVSTTAGSRTITATSGTFSASDVGKRVDVAGVNQVGALSGVNETLTAFIMHYTDSTHVVISRKVPFSKSGKTATIYTWYDATAVVTDVEVSGCSYGVLINGSRDLCVRNLRSYGNVNDGIQFTSCQTVQADGIHAYSNGNHGGAMNYGYGAQISNLNCHDNGVHGWVMSLGCMGFTATNVNCSANGNIGFDIDVDEHTGEGLLHETNASLSNFVTNHNVVGSGLALSYCTDVVATGITSIGNGNDGIIIIGRSNSVDNYNCQDNAGFGIDMPTATFSPAAGYNRIGVGILTGNVQTQQFGEGAVHLGTGQYLGPKGFTVVADPGAGGTAAINAGLGELFSVTAAAGNITLGNPTNRTTGQIITFVLNASGGARTFTFDLDYRGVDGSGAGGRAVISVGSGNAQTISFRCLTAAGGTNSWVQQGPVSGDMG